VAHDLPVAGPRLRSRVDRTAVPLLHAYVEDLVPGQQLVVPSGGDRLARKIVNQIVSEANADPADRHAAIEILGRHLSEMAVINEVTAGRQRPRVATFDLQVGRHVMNIATLQAAAGSSLDRDRHPRAVENRAACEHDAPTVLDRHRRR
jgi:hypothetical protein